MAFPMPAVAAATASRKYFLTSAVSGGESDPGMTISTVGVDREGDRVMPEGGDFSKFLKNPVLVWSHDYSNIPIGSVTQLEVVPGEGVRARWKWLEGDPFADRVKNAWDQRAINASSIGFIARDVTPNESNGRDITKWEMLELSLCAIPMNPEAVRALKALTMVEPDAKSALTPPPVLVDEPVDVKVVPGNVSSKKATLGDAWSTPALKDFTGKDWDDLSDAERTHVAGHYAWKDGDEFADLHLPHHRPSDGAVVFRGVAAAAARLNHTEGIDAKAAKAHLAQHYRQFKKSPPWEKTSLAETSAELKTWLTERATSGKSYGDSPSADIYGATSAINCLQSLAASELAGNEAHASLIRDAVGLVIAFLAQEFGEQFESLDAQTAMANAMPAQNDTNPGPAVATPKDEPDRGSGPDVFIDPDDYPFVTVHGLGEGHLVSKDAFALLTGKGRIAARLMKQLHDAHEQIKAAGVQVNDVLTSAGRMSDGPTDKGIGDEEDVLDDKSLTADHDDIKLDAIAYDPADADAAVTDADLREAIRSAVGDQLREELARATSAAIGRARGRLPN